MTIRILVADDHHVVRHGLRQVFALDSDMDVVSEAKDAWETIEQVEAGGYDLIVLDLSMPGPGGLHLIERIKSTDPAARVLVLSMHADSQIAARAIKAGAKGYLTKDSEAHVIISAARQVSRGANFIDPSLATKMIFSSDARPSDGGNHNLTNREFEVFLALVRGQSLGDIAAQLGLSVKTISTHKFRLMRKLGFTTMSELVRYAVRSGLVDT